MADTSRSEWVGDIFSKERFDSLSLDELDELFEPPPEYTDLSSRSNHFLLGAKGSGKSTLLRSLTLPLQLRRNSPPKFAGVYIALRHDELSTLRSAASDAGTSAHFEHYFLLTVLLELLRQWSPISNEDIVDNLLSPFLGLPSSFTRSELAKALASDRYKCIDAAKTRPVASLDAVELAIGRVTNLSSISELAEIASTTASSLPTAEPLGLLIDSLDHYGELTPLLFPLFESDASHPVVMKAAARRIDLPLHQQESRSRRLDLHRDFEIVSLDRRPDAGEHNALVKSALIRRARFLGPADISDLDDNEIMRLLFGGPVTDTEPYASFEAIMSVTSGNILQAIILLDMAATQEREHLGKDGRSPTAHSSISPGSRDTAVRTLSREYWQYEIGEAVPHRTREMRALFEVLLDRSPTDPDAEHRAPRLRVVAIPDEEIQTVRRLISERLFLLLDPRAHGLIQAGHGDFTEIAFELNRLLLPDKDVLPVAGPIYKAEWRPLYEKAIERIESKRMRRPTATRRDQEPTLFLDEPPVFISRSLDKSRRQRVAIVKLSLDRLFAERHGGRPERGQAWIDIDLIDNAGQFRRDIRSAVARSLYVVADITDGSLSPRGSAGIFYEIGLAIAAGKPVGLFHNAKMGDPPVDLRIDSLPSVLTSRTILTHDRATTNFLRHDFEPFDSALRREAMTKAGSESPEEEHAPYAYISIQPHNALMAETLNEEVASLLPDLIVRTSATRPGDLMELQSLISGAALRIIDASGGASGPCIELGLAAFDSHSGSEHYGTLMVFDATGGISNPVAMYPGERLPWRSNNREDRRQIRMFLEQVARREGLGWQQ